MSLVEQEIKKRKRTKWENLEKLGKKALSKAGSKSKYKFPKKKGIPKILQLPSTRRLR